MKVKSGSIGHAEHTKEADSQRGLPGEFERTIKVVVLGAGSGFTPRLLSDVLKTPGLKGLKIALVDIDVTRLKTMRSLVGKLCEGLGRREIAIEASTDRREVLPGADYIINCIEVSGLECVRLDNDIPRKYGVDQCIGDTLGPGGLFKGLRTAPVFLDVLKEAEDLCPHALVLNYTNPMSTLCLAAGRRSKMQVVGLCHSVQGTSHLLAERAEVPYETLEWECAGINHLAWFVKLCHRGRDLYPLLKRKAKADLEGTAAGHPDSGDLVRKSMMLHFGAFITESSGHLSEYLPYFRKNTRALRKYCRKGYEGGSSFYADSWPQWRKDADRKRMAMLEGRESIDWPRSWEYASWIIEAREKNAPFRIHGNVMNSLGGGDTVISNLPADGCVEVACLVDRNGIQPTRFGKLPPQMAGICASNMAYFDLAATAAAEKSSEAAIHALMLDPLTAAVCTLDEIREMAVEMLKAQKKFLPGFRIPK